MIKKFKLFENVENMQIKLINQFDDNFIDKYFDDNFLEDAEEIISLWPNTIWNFVNDDEYVKDVIRDEISSRTIDDFSEEDYISYLRYNITDNKEEKIIELYNKKEDKEDEEYDFDMLDSLTEDELREIIQDDDEEEKFVEYVITSYLSDKDAQEVIEDIYGASWITDNGRNIYNMLRYYVKDSEIVEEWRKNTNRREKVEEEVYNDKQLQNILLNKKKSNVFLLSKLFIEENGDNISDEYDFQKAYITRYVKKNKGNKLDDNLRAEAIKYLYDNFELNYEIEEEYADDMWMIGMDKFNI